MAEAQSPRNLNPATWGPSFWRVLHTVAFSYPEQPTDAQKQAAESFFNSLTELLPCEKCRKHYTAFLRENPVAAHNSSGSELSEYIYDFHNRVNQRLGKTQTPSYDQAQAVLLASGAVAPAANSSGCSLLWLVLGLVLLVGAALWLFRK